VLTEGDAVRQLQGCACWAAATIGGYASDRMNRDEFFATLAPLDAEQRVTFRRLATEAQSALHATDSGPAEEAMELMIDLACHVDGCFRSDDPLEATKFVVSQAVSALGETMLDARGAEFTAQAVPQLMRWEREYGWAQGTSLRCRKPVPPGRMLR